MTERMPRDPKKQDKRYIGNLRPQDVKALGIGIELSVVIGGFSYGGHWLDEQWGTSPWLLLTGVCIGTFGGGWHAMKLANGGKLPDLGFKPKTTHKPDDSTKESGDDQPGKPK